MIQLFSKILKGFSAASGPLILLALITSRLLSIVASWVAYRLIHPEGLAPAIYAFQIIAFLIPFMGLGLYHGTLKYGAELSQPEARMALYHAVLRRGRKWNILLVALLCGSGYIWDWGFPQGGRYLMIFSWMLFFSFEYEMQRVAFRLSGRNDYYARSEMLHWGLVLVFVSIGAWLFGAEGYALAFVIAPALTTGYWYLRQTSYFRKPASSPPPIQGFFIRYGIHTAFANVIAKLLFAVDIILIGRLLTEESAVSLYKYLTLIPFSVLFMSNAYMTAHFVELSAKMRDVEFIRNFIREYHLLFGFISIAFVVFCYFFGPMLLALFGDELLPYLEVFVVLSVGVTGILFLRGLYGNLLGAFGRSDLAFYAGLLGLVVNIVSNFWLIPKYGLMGAALTSAGVMWLTGLVSAGFFYSIARCTGGRTV